MPSAEYTDINLIIGDERKKNITINRFCRTSMQITLIQ